MPERPSVLTNTKYRCERCGAIEDFEDRAPTPCRNCGEFEWGQIVVVLVCDFCGDNVEDGWWSYPCQSFAVPEPPGYRGPKQMSDGDWCACAVCHRLITAGKVKKLSTRAAKHTCRRNPEMAPFLDGVIQFNLELHRLFLKNRTGPPVYETRKENDR